MDYWGIVRESWHVAWRNRPLWWLSLVRAVGGLLGGLVVLSVSLPLALGTVLPTLSDGQAGSLPFDSDTVFSWLSRYGVWILLGVGLVLLVWMLVAVVDVAAFGGLVGEVDSAERGAGASASRGLRTGFSAWWRVAGLLAISVLPTLIVLLVRAAVLYGAVAVPLQLGRTVAPGSFAFASQGLQSLQSFASLLAIPLGVLVQLAARFAVIDGTPVGASLRGAWDLCRRKLSEVVLMYLVMLLIGIVVGLVAAVIVTILIGVVVAGGIAFYAGESAGGLVAAGVGLGVVLAAGLAFAVVYTPFQVALWSVLWQGLTDRDPRFVRHVAPPYVAPVPVGPPPPVPPLQAAPPPPRPSPPAPSPVPPPHVASDPPFGEEP